MQSSDAAFSWMSRTQRSCQGGDAPQPPARGSARLGATRLSTARLTPTRHGTARLGSTLRRTSRLPRRPAQRSSRGSCDPAGPAVLRRKAAPLSAGAATEQLRGGRPMAAPRGGGGPAGPARWRLRGSPGRGSPCSGLTPRRVFHGGGETAFRVPAPSVAAPRGNAVRRSVRVPPRGAGARRARVPL